ncbi:tRNA (5-methylaminomethyl-2-thiouridine)(34)-methyltransferase MnmD [Roseovarius aestuarii]|uniref:tRNA 5-methylaminomethyl-2-thiouridine biosynthesis bifunctional protein MnmC n=1 Tax=Roseovarius aestuarii TaxID=475083 RepID=A0A1X7BS23_9RHOB|nr:tRNA (5-methylaminomethyl-2-thiouridine)(34)-methyltransferase MnmD [Roseovarius aestuarii]SMC12412.1 tRNA 5-methylaminomethyl-2-thiouridine biosynthesis bifunctional protein MnmC [Roseovarius aestuarii]
MQGQQAEIDWRDGDVPVSTRFDDPYFSLENGLAETRYVFLEGNGLPGRFRDGFHVAELGFGTGLNFLTTVLAWWASDIAGKLHFTSFEAYPMAPGDMAQALSAFPELSEVTAPLVAAWAQGNGKIDYAPDIELHVIEGDAREVLPDWTGQADAWYLDGFSPAKNPELWGEDLMAEVGRHTAEGGTAATYTAAGFVRRGLDAAGFDVTRRPGYGRKRHMSTAVLRQT